MSLFRPRPAESVEARVATLTAGELIAQARTGGRIDAGVNVTDDEAMRLSAVWGCVDLIAEVVSTLPIDEFRDVGPEMLPVEQPTPPIIEDPAGDGYGFEAWCRAAMTSFLLRGNVYGLIDNFDDRLYPRTINLLHPDRVSWHRPSSFGPVAQWYLDQEPIERYPAGPLWHVPAYTIAGHPVGLSPISYAAQTVGLGIATRRFGAQWFGDGAHPTAYLENDQPLAQIQDAKAVKQRVMDAMSGNREPLILGGGWHLNTVQVAPNESQFLETIKANADDVARFFFRRPPGEGGQVTYANVEARSLDLLTYTINGWLVRIEKALSRLRPRGRYVKFNADALIRVDTETRYKAHTEAIRGGWAIPNERRRKENLPPLPGGDQLLWPPYTTTAATEPNTPDDPAMEDDNDEDT